MKVAHAAENTDMATKKRKPAASKEKAQSVIEYRLDSLEAVVGEVRDAVQGVHASLLKLATLEEKHLGYVEELKDHEVRLRAIEVEIPTLKMVRRWIIGGVTGMLALSGIALLNLLFIADNLKELIK